MLNPEAIIHVDDGWRFSNEEYLEEFVWDNLYELFRLKPLQRQLGVRGEYCDILATNDDDQLTIIELKNCEDRYVVQQLTRYFDNLYCEKPLAEIIDYSQPIRLVAVAPSFHRHNYIDQKYCTLNVDFVPFRLEALNQNLHFILGDADQERRIEIPYQVDSFGSHIAAPQRVTKPPKALTSMLDEHFPDSKQNVLSIRRKILGFSDRFGETSTKVVQRYGLRKNDKDIYKSKLCAEFYAWSFNKGNKGSYVFRISLWLPYANERYVGKGYYKKAVAKMFLVANFTDSNFSLDTPIQALDILRNPKPSVLASSKRLPFRVYSNILERTTGQKITDNRLAALIELALEERLLDEAASRPEEAQ